EPPQNKTPQLSWLRTFCGTEDTSPKSSLTKEKKSSRRTSENKPSLAETDLAIAIPKARGLDPHRSPGRISLYTGPSSWGSTLSQPLHFSAGPPAAGSGMVRVSCQLSHVCKKRRRLANEKPHVCQELQSAHRNALRLGRSNDRNNGKTWIQERAWLGHDQSLVEELVFHLQIRKCH